MRGILLLIFSFFICLNIQGQKLNSIIFQPTSKDSSLDKKLGSAYFDEDFTSGELRFIKKGNSENYPLRYNAYLDVFEVEFEGVRYNISKTSGINLELKNESYVFRAYYNLYSKEVKTGYLHKLNNSPFFVRHVKEIREGRKPANSVAAVIPDKLIEIKKLYVEDNSGSIREIKWNSKSILKHLPQEEKQILTKYIKDNKLKVKRQEDLYQLLEYHKELLKKNKSLANQKKNKELHIIKT